MSDPPITEGHTAMGVLAAVCGVLLTAAGTSTRQMAKMIESLQRVIDALTKRLEERDKDVAALNNSLIQSAREAGQAYQIQVERDELEADNTQLLDEIEQAKADRDEARAERDNLQAELARLQKLYHQAVPAPGQSVDDAAETLTKDPKGPTP